MIRRPHGFRLRALLLLVVFCAAMVAWPSESAVALTCGGFRWPIKTLSDDAARQVDYPSLRDTSVRHLRKLDPPANLEADTPRIHRVEFTTYRIHAELVGGQIIEGDHDVHVVIQEPTNKNRTMIVEFPNPRCPGVRDSIKRAVMRRARNQLFDACPRITDSFRALVGDVTLVGVGFWDKRVEFSRHAPNGIELHPVLRFHGSCSNP